MYPNGKALGWMNSKSESWEGDNGLSPGHICGDGECCAGGSRMGGGTRRKAVALLANAACRGSGITAVNCPIIPFFFSLLLERVESINKTDGSSCSSTAGRHQAGACCCGRIGRREAVQRQKEDDDSE